MNDSIDKAAHSLLASDALLEPYKTDIKRRIANILSTETRLTGQKMPLADFASGHEFFGLHFDGSEWVFREWAPNAEAIYLLCDGTGWREMPHCRLQRTVPDGVWEIRLPASALAHQDLYRLRVYWNGGSGDRIPAYARRVVQDPETLIFNAQVWLPENPYQWQYPDFRCKGDSLLIYEVHVGMAQEKEGIGTYADFRKKTLPRIIAAGYNAIQIMAIQEHPYYASFGYQVSSFFAASSRFGTPDELKALIDEAHGAGLCVIMDLIHSHAVSNEVEGLSRFDGTTYQYFHAGPRGQHPAWDSRCFDYGKIQVLHFLLSNCRFWLDEYRLDGFRFDGITSMLYLDHGLGRAFVSYDDYFTGNVDEDALTYLALANKTIHQVRPDAVTVAEDISGMPGLAFPVTSGGFGFDYRFAMGIPDFWIKLTKDTPDEHWPLGHLWFELINRRHAEKTITYAESHDQALVGDQTLIFRMLGAAIYDHMNVNDDDPRADRGIALHKMIRLITLATAGHGYLNFMGNEFGHPEWIDFPRKENNWSYKYARRQWSLADNPKLNYHYLGRFDKDMIALARKYNLLGPPGPELLHAHDDDKVIAFARDGLIFAFNFHPVKSYPDYGFFAPSGKYRMILTTDDALYAGHKRLKKNQVHFTQYDGHNSRNQLLLYLPSRTALVLAREDEK
jgi:1,4-alpha-glucan branching enzyme